MSHQYTTVTLESLREKGVPITTFKDVCDIDEGIQPGTIVLKTEKANYIFAIPAGTMLVVDKTAGVSS